VTGAHRDGDDGCVLVAVISDTHMPRGSRELPGRCIELIAQSDAVIHAGDICTLQVLGMIERISSPVHAVRGNVDDASLQRLPISRRLELGGWRIGLIHDAGIASGRLERLRSLFPEADGVIFGHTHRPQHESRGGFQIFNPGSPTERRRSPRRAMGLMRVSGRALRFEHVWLSRSE
jgi:putative phosphoesterase